MATERLMGIENEFAFNALNRTGGVADRQAALELMSELAETLFVSLPCLSASGVFLENGSRLYVDCGQHLEYCTPECTQPWDVVRYLHACERMLTQLAAEVARQKRFRSAIFYRCNVDYSGTGSTWGTHESYMHRTPDAKQLPGDLIPHFVSRIVYTGAGGFDPLAGPLACTFSLSPRVHHIKTAISNDSTRDRGIFHTKSESLAVGNYQRLHVLVGESLCSETGNWLKIATTALVVAMTEAGLKPGRDVTLASPVEALHAFARDVTLGATRAVTTSGRALTAIEIQRHYLTLAQMNVHAAWMPAWAPWAVEQWDAVLHKLEQGPDGGAGGAVGTCLDWAIKRQIFGRHLRKRGFTWEQLEGFSDIVGLLHGAMKALKPEPPPGGSLRSAFVLESTGAFRDVVDEFTTDLDELQLKWEQLDDYLKLRVELFEIDTRFGQLGPDGIFNRLDAAGVLNHRFPGIDNIEHAMTNPPAMGRARFRSAAIRECHSRRGEFGCDWDFVHHFNSDRVLDLSDPWTVQADWQPEPRPSAAPERLPGLHRFFAMRDARQRLRAATASTAAGAARTSQNEDPF